MYFKDKMYVRLNLKEDHPLYKEFNNRIAKLLSNGEGKLLLDICPTQYVLEGEQECDWLVSVTDLADRIRVTLGVILDDVGNELNEIDARVVDKMSNLELYKYLCQQLTDCIEIVKNRD